MSLKDNEVYTIQSVNKEAHTSLPDAHRHLQVQQTKHQHSSRLGSCHATVKEIRESQAKSNEEPGIVFKRRK